MPETDQDLGPITPDGCAVEVYRRLPGGGEADLLGRLLPPRSRVLELGCGTGRLANALAGLGHDVVGVDESADMLDHLRGVTPVRETIEDLRLDPTFDAVILAANLISTAGFERRRRYLDSCERHLADGGLLVAQWFPPSWFDGISAAGGRARQIGPVHCRLSLVSADDDRVTAETTYEIDDRSWTQRFTAYRMTEDRLAVELGLAGLSLERWVDEAHAWFVARRSAAPR
ncbi:class I SAM-dependent methyltransferase [Actinoplanes sp. NPDC026623]|uniref:class I SAM-dependent methyltransferase n=1 Tax=Actinoplanes sp. NPDC026623 TaxID=3155610 RepID=UPI0034111BB7